MIANPQGIDLPIQQLQQLFISRLWTEFNCQFNHRTYKTYENDRLVPKVLIEGSDRYTDVTFDNKLDALCWFDVGGETDNIDGEFITEQVGIFFAVNLSKIYPTLAHRAEEEAHSDVLKMINRKKRSFKVVKLIKDEKAFGAYYIDELKAYNMQPWHTFRFNCNVNYSYNC